MLSAPEDRGHSVQREVNRLNNYEIMFIIAAALEEDKRNASIDMVKDIITKGEGEITDVNEWGMKKLAYPILKKNEGYYVVMEFKAPAELPLELDRRLKISDNVIRHMIINKDE